VLAAFKSRYWGANPVSTEIDVEPKPVYLSILLRPVFEANAYPIKLLPDPLTVFSVPSSIVVELNARSLVVDDAWAAFVLRIRFRLAPRVLPPTMVDTLSDLDLVMTKSGVTPNP
jgi:hypothetical protein